MKESIRNHRFRPSRFVLLALGALLLCGSILVILEKAHVTDFIKAPASSTDTDGPTKEQQEQLAKADAQAKQTYLDNVAKSDSSNGDTSSTSADSQTSSGTLAVTASQSSDTVTVLTQMQGVTAGTCKLTITKGGSSTTKSAQVIYQPEFSSCAGFSVPVNPLGAGSWNISVAVTPDSGATLTKSTILEVN